MWKKIILTGALTVAAVIFTGCSSVESTNRFNALQVTESPSVPVAHIVGSTYGWYLFYFIPFFTGSTTSPGSTVMFNDKVHLGGVMDMVSAQAKQLGATKVIDIQTRKENEWMSSTFIFWRREIQMSCTAVK